MLFPAAPPVAVAAPVAHTPLVGRTHDLGRLEALLLAADTRWVTLLGVTGVGKTRLVAALLEQVNPRLPVRAFDGLSGHFGHDFFASLAATLPANGATLLVLDHVEAAFLPGQDLRHHLQRLLERHPHLRLLIASQRPLHSHWERPFVLEPLAVRAVDGLASPATQLFTLAAKRIPSQTWAGEHDQNAIHALCGALGGLPLALEVAAAQCAFLTPHEMLEHTPALLRLPNPWHRTAHHATLETAITRQLHALSDTERLALECACACAGPVGLHALQAMLECSAADALAVMHALCETHLIERCTLDGELRFRPLNVLSMHLASVNATEVRSRHLRHFAHLAQHLPSTAVFLRERPDLERARSFALDHAQGAALGQVSRAFVAFDPDQTHVSTVIETALAQLETMPDDVSANLLNACVEHLSNHGQFVRAEPLARQAAPLVARTGNVALEHEILNRLAWIVSRLGRETEAEDLLQHTVRTLEARAPSREYAMALQMLADLHLPRGDIDRSLALFSQARDVFEALGDFAEAAGALRGLACTHAAREENELAVTLMRNAIRLAREHDRPDATVMLEILGQLELRIERWADAWAHLAEAIRYAQESTLWERALLGMTGIAQLLYHAGLHPLAAQAMGHAGYLRWRYLPELTGYAKINVANELGNLERSMNPADLEHHTRQGQSWHDPNALVAHLHGQSEVQAFLYPNPEPKASTLERLLSKRQLEVLRLVRAGLTNKRIAQRLGLSERTVKFHMGEVFNKLGVRNRMQAQRMLETSRDLAPEG